MRDRMLLAGLTAALVVALLITGCGDDGDTVADEPPWCLSETELPVEAEAVETVMAVMPEEHAGARRELTTSDERVEVYYDEPLEGMPSIQAFSIAALTAAFPEAGELSGFEAMEIVLEAGQDPVDPGGVTGELDQISMDPNADLLWVTGDTVEVGETPAEDVRAPSITFASPDGSWIFTIMASTEDQRLQLVEAFCDATSP